MARSAWTKSVRFQLTLWYLTTLALILLLAAVLLLWGVRRTLLRETDRTLATEAAQIVRLLTPPSDPGERHHNHKEKHKDKDERHDERDLPDPVDVLEQVGPGANRLPGVVPKALYLRLERADDRRTVALSPSLRGFDRLMLSLVALPTTPLPAYVLTGPDEEAEVRCLTVRVPQTAFLLQVATPWDPVEDLLTRLAWGIGAAIGLFLLLSGVGSWLLVGRSFRPLERLVLEAEQMTAERLVPMRLHPQASDNEIGRLVAALNRMTTRLGTAFAAQRRFTADASHEMRTPLTILQGEFELALARERPALEYRRILQSGLEETRRLARIVENLALLARGDAESVVRAPFEPVSLSALAVDTAQAFRRSLQDKSLRLTLETDGPATVEGDPEALHRVALNLLDNAIRYTPLGGQITIGTETSQTECRLIVADTGIGINPVDLPQIFERFFRADKARVNDGGSGLGLSIAQSIIAAHSGQITVESQPGAGSRFVVTLPHINEN